MAERKDHPIIPPRRNSKPLLKKTSDGGRSDIDDSASRPAVGHVIGSHTGISEIVFNDDLENITIGNQQPFSTSSQDEDDRTLDMKLSSKGKLDNRLVSSDKKVKGIKKGKSTPALSSASTEASDVAKHAMTSKMATSPGPSFNRPLIPNERSFVGNGSIRQEEGWNEIMYHALRGEWGRVEHIVRFNQKNNSTGAFLADKVSTGKSTEYTFT